MARSFSLEFLVGHELRKAGCISPIYGRFRDATGGISLIYGSLFLKNEAFHTPLPTVSADWPAIYKREASGQVRGSAMHKRDEDNAHRGDDVLFLPTCWASLSKTSQ